MTPLPNPEFWSVRKPVVQAAGGLVASQHYLASEVGARVLADGGNAVDAAVATGLAIGCVEPWMSGIGGGGYMLVAPAGSDAVYAVDFGMVAPRGLDPADYPLAEDAAGDLFGWPGVVDDRNIHGYRSIAVPGHVAGMALALERFGSRSWADSLAPAIELAERGMQIDWYAALMIAGAAAILRRYETTAATYLADGLPPVPDWQGNPAQLRLGNLARTLRRLAEAGPRDFYEGEVARQLVDDARAGGSTLDAGDLAAYHAQVVEAEAFDYRDARIFAAPGLTAGPTLRHVLQRLNATPLPGGQAPGAEAYAAYAEALFEAYAVRLASMGDADETVAPSCTTHLSVVDRDGNMVALTQTLLSLFGSRVMLPETGILMNNGIMWFDPRPGRPNSIAPGKRPLSNMCPTVARRGDGFRFALGASGGRRIMPAIAQLTSFLVDYGMELDEAVHQPRIDVSGTDTIAADARLDAAVTERLAAGHPVRRVSHGVYPPLFACPNVVGRQPGGGNMGAAFVMSPWARVVAEGA
ncbi:MAG TPA: gamma-glutamyltransferase [Alphaproteobacteria bacterium]|nr:gamma-glutamyltransferase [Alphaproteobacteria bacterium]